MGKPWEGWFNERGEAVHAYCPWCGKVLRGPHAGETWPLSPSGKPVVQAADNERTYTAEEAEAAGLEHNVSGSICPDCYQATIDEYRRGREERIAEERRRMAGPGTESA